MDGTRRRFLKLAGAHGVVGLPAGCCRPFEAWPRPTGRRSPSQARAAADGQALGHGHRPGSLRDDDGWDRCIDGLPPAHNVPDFDDPKDEIKWIWTEEFEHGLPDQEHEHIWPSEYAPPRGSGALQPLRQPALHPGLPHPGDLEAGVDGIVMMDWHRCIGCRYCVVACPYGSRSFNWRDPRPPSTKITSELPDPHAGRGREVHLLRGAARQGQMPACVEACEHNEMVFGDLEDPNSEVEAAARGAPHHSAQTGLGTQPEVYYIV